MRSLRFFSSLVPLAIVAALAACADPKPAATTGLPDGAGGPDSAAAEAVALDGQADNGDAGAGSGSGIDGDASADEASKPDVSAADTTTPADSAPDVGADLVADAAPEVVAQEVKAETVAETSADVAADTVPAETVADVAPEVGSDAAAEVADAKDGAVADTVPTDAGPTDTGPSVCKPGELKRCWVECPQTYAAGCISGQIPILILGTQACTAGQWGACDVKHQCSEFANGPCQNASKASQNYLCTNGIPMTGAHICTKPLGANCTLSYYINWPIYDCPLICKGPDDVCAAEGAERDCEVHCGSATGPTKPGKQKCQNVCDGLHWNMCSTGEACK
ncbi:MAG: hypothetical protein FJ100_23970 [Deltaproteobacteria bacterium]|nr:hypothetical protein [Deltaproteobacteria bacterium]